MNYILFIAVIFLLCFFCFKGVPTPISGLVCTALLCLCLGMDITAALTDTYMSGFVNFVRPYWQLLLFGSLFGKLLEISGGADSIAKAVLKLTGTKYVLIGMMLVIAIMTIGGISVFVCIYATFPICIKLCSQANLPRKYVVITFSAAVSFACGLPWTPSINNVVPTTYLGTGVDAAWLPGVITSILYIIACTFFILWRAGVDTRRGLGFTAATVAGSLEDLPEDPGRKYPHALLALLPLAVTIISLNVVKLSVNYALLCGCLSAVIFLFPYLPHKWPEVKSHAVSACSNGMFAIINTSAVVGFGAVVQSTEVFSDMMVAVTGLNTSPLLGAFLTSTALAAVCGSSSAGISMASPILAEYFAPLYNAEALHRIATIGSLGLDSLPNCGFIQVEYSYAGCSVPEAYPQSFVLTVVFTLTQGLLFILIAPLFGY